VWLLAAADEKEHGQLYVSRFFFGNARLLRGGGVYVLAGASDEVLKRPITAAEGGFFVNAGGWRC
jgi:hypothetical protein